MPDFIAKAVFSSRTVFFVLAAALCLAPPPCRAEAAGDEDARKLERLFSGILDGYRAALESRGGGLTAEGGVMVEKSEAYYAVTLPRLEARAANGAHVVIGMIAVNALPAGDGEGRWRMTVALPSPVTAYDPKGRAVITVEIGGQSFSGVWDESFGGFTGIEASYRGVSLYNAADDVRADLPDLGLSSALHPSGDGLWSGTARLGVSGLSAVFGGGDGGTARIGELSLAAAVEDYAPGVPRGAAEEKPERPGVMDLYCLAAGMPGGAWDGLSLDASFRDFAFDSAVSAKKAAPVRAGQARAGLSVTGARGNGSLRLSFSGDGFDAAAAFPELEGLLPSRAALDLAAERLSCAGAAAGSGASVSLSGTGFGNGHYDVTADGALTADAAAQRGFAGKASALARGFDYVMDRVGKNLENPAAEAEAKGRLREWQAALSVLQLAGQPQPDGARRYELEITPQGGILVNGADIGVLLPKAQPGTK